MTLRHDSPRSTDSGPHSSDDEFLDDDEEGGEDDYSMYYRVDTEPSFA